MFVLLYKLIPLKPLGYRGFGNLDYQRKDRVNRFYEAFLLSPEELRKAVVKNPFDPEYLGKDINAICVFVRRTG